MTSTFLFRAPVAILFAAVLASGPVIAATRADIALTVLMNPGDALRADNLGPYVHGQQNVRAVLLGNDSGNFIFDTNDSDRRDGGRRLVMDFDAYNPGAPLGDVTADVFIGTIGANGDGTDGNLQLLKVGDPPMFRRTQVNWIATDGTQYSLRWDGGAGHGLLAFSCASDTVTPTGRQCVSWTVAPSDPALKAALFTVVTTKRGSVATLVGEYSMPFQWTLNR